MPNHTFIVYKNGNPEDVVVRLYCSLSQAQAINYNIENHCAYGYTYQIRQID